MKASFKDPKFMSKEQIEYFDALADYFPRSVGTVVDKAENFAKYATRTSIARFLTKYEIFKRVLDVQGVIVECGVLFGGGLMIWAQLSSIMEPANHQRRIVGFDTFSGGFPSVSKKDTDSKDATSLCYEGSHSADSYEDLQECIRIYDMTRYFKHIEKVELVPGDVLKTVPLYMKKNPHLVVSLLYLDMDVYQPTKIALRYFLPRMPKGAIIVFDELNQSMWPGETLAVLRQFTDLNGLRIKKLPFGTAISYLEVGA